MRSQYKECFVVVRCSHGGETYSRCVYIWVDKDFASARGWYQGYPKKLGQIWMTRPVTVGARRPSAGAGRACSAPRSPRTTGGSPTSTLTLTGESDAGGFVNALPMLHSR